MAGLGKQSLGHMNNLIPFVKKQGFSVFATNMYLHVQIYFLGHKISISNWNGFLL